MKARLNKSAALIFLLVLLASCTPNINSIGTGSGSVYPSQFLIGETYILENGERIEGDIVGVGTNLTIHEGARVTGDISLVGSVLEMGGEVNGDINVFAGTSTIKDTAFIRGDINQISHQALIAPNARILGEANTYTFPNISGEGLGKGVNTFINWFRPANWIFLLFGRMIIFVLTALLVITLFPEPTKRVVASIQGNIAPAWGVGIISLLVVPFISFILIITICLSPIGLILLLLLVISYIWGWIGLSFLFGQRLFTWLGLEQKNEIITVAGAAILTLLTMLIGLVPVAGFLLNLMVSSIGLGGVVFSRFGIYSRQAD
jgi:hypothetical protein